MTSFFASYITELVDYSELIVKQYPQDESAVSTHLALLSLKKFLQQNQNRLNNTAAYRISQDTSFIDLLEKTARMENAFALFLLGMLKLEGMPAAIKRDQTSGSSLVALSAARGCHWAMQTVGNFHMRGDNSFFDQNFAQAEQYFAAALQMMPENIRALRNLGLCCLYQGKMHQAMHYLLLANKQGDTTLEEVYALYSSQQKASKPVVAVDNCKVTKQQGNTVAPPRRRLMPCR